MRSVEAVAHCSMLPSKYPLFTYLVVSEKPRGPLSPGPQRARAQRAFCYCLQRVRRTRAVSHATKRARTDEVSVCASREYGARGRVHARRHCVLAFSRRECFGQRAALALSSFRDPTLPASLPYSLPRARRRVRQSRAPCRSISRRVGLGPRASAAAPTRRPPARASPSPPQPHPQPDHSPLPVPPTRPQPPHPRPTPRRCAHALSSAAALCAPTSLSPRRWPGRVGHRSRRTLPPPRGTPRSGRSLRGRSRGRARGAATSAAAC